MKVIWRQGLAGRPMEQLRSQDYRRAGSDIGVPHRLELQHFQKGAYGFDLLGRYGDWTHRMKC